MATSNPSDDTLMKAYARGDAAAFEQLYARHQAALYRFVRRLLGPSLAAQTDEVFQDTWLRVVHARERWEPQGAAFRTWLFTLAHHRAVDLLRRSGREISVDAYADDGDEPWQPEAAPWQHWPAPAGSAPQGEELAFWRRAGERLLHCLEQLPLPQKSAFLLHHDDGLALDEVARALEVGFETAKTRLRYAMSKLRTCMGAYLEPVGGGNAMSGPDRDDARDAWLSQALRHAPDADAAPPSALSASILAEARAAAAPVQPSRARQRTLVDVLHSWWIALARPPVAAAFASVMAATIVGLMWWDQPMDQTLPPAPASAPVPAATRAAPASPPAVAVLDQPQAKSVAPAAKPAIADAVQAAPPAALRKQEAPTAFPATEPRRDSARERVEEAKKDEAPSSFASPAPTPPTEAAPAPARVAAPTPAPAAAPLDAGRATGSARGEIAADRAEAPMARSAAPAREPQPAALNGLRQGGAMVERRANTSSSAGSNADAVERERAAPSRSPLSLLLEAIAREPQRWSRETTDRQSAELDAGWRAWLADLDSAAAMRWQRTGGTASTAGDDGRDSAPLRLLRDGRAAATVRLDGRTVRLDQLLADPPEHWQAVLGPPAASRLLAARARLAP